MAVRKARVAPGSLRGGMKMLRKIVRGAASDEAPGESSAW